ncbi:MAG: hypothetical protein KF684_05580 [Phycisphaeraceae bacterium]|nr:hypothetical protein [Phycisphaeraceae bacterium]
MKRRFVFGLSAAAILSAGAVAEVVPATPAVTQADIIRSLADIVDAGQGDASTRLRLASMLIELGQEAEGRAMIMDAIELDPNIEDMLYPGAKIARGDCVGCELGNTGADVIVGDLPGVGYFGESNGFRAYSIATTSCNVGTQILNWFQNNNQHPVIAQNMYRYDGRRFEQIGIGHLKHGFCALQQGICQTPGNPCQPTGGGCMQTLGIFCSDPYDASLNGQQSRLGPRWQVNPFTGQFAYPFQGGSYSDATLGRRINVAVTDVTNYPYPANRFFAEGHYIALDDSQAGNGGNNASYREIRPIGAQFATQGATVRTKPAIEAWKAIDNEVLLDIVEPATDGRLYVASRAYDNGDGTWDYEYAVYNLNNDASGRNFRVPVGSANITGMGFKGVRYHSGDGISGVTYDMTPWTSQVSGSDMVWSLVDVGPNSFALRWGTLYNFRFTANAGPEETDATIGFFKNGGSITARVVAPAATCTLTADTNGDNVVNFSDLNVVLSAFGQTGPGNPADVNNDGAVNFSDLNAVLSEFGIDCN